MVILLFFSLALLSIIKLLGQCDGQVEYTNTILVEFGLFVFHLDTIVCRLAG